VQQFRRAVQLGAPSGLVGLGYAAYNGLGGEAQNLTAAFGYYEQAAAQGDVQARFAPARPRAAAPAAGAGVSGRGWQGLYNMGEMLRAGTGVARDRARAFKLFSAAAGGGHFKAMHMMALSFWFGWATKPQTLKHWFPEAESHRRETGGGGERERERERARHGYIQISQNVALSENSLPKSLLSLRGPPRGPATRFAQGRAGWVPRRDRGPQPHGGRRGAVSLSAGGARSGRARTRRFSRSWWRRRAHGAGPRAKPTRCSRRARTPRPRRSLRAPRSRGAAAPLLLLPKTNPKPLPERS
jgi:hypothetical protein